MTLRPALVLVLLASGGCGYDIGDPLSRPGTWRSTADNDTNLQIMAMDPHDLVQGRGVTTSRGAEAVPPIDRLRSGTRYPLPSLSTLDVTATPSQQPQGQGAGVGVQSQ